MNLYKYYSEPLLKYFLARLLKLQLINKALLPFIQKPNDKIYIFIVGCYNSGTTLLEYILAKHEEISSLPTEGIALSSELFGPEYFGWNRMWWMCREKLEICMLPVKPDAERLKKEWSIWFDRKKSFWLEKSIINSLNIDWFEKNFDSPYFIWIIRNGYAVAEGIKRRTFEKGRHPENLLNGYPIEMCAKQWVYSNQVIEEKIENTKNWMKIHYEEITGNPDSGIEKVLDFLPVKKKTINMPRYFAFQGKTKKIMNMNNKSIKKLLAKDICAITSVAGKELLKHGYQLLNGKQ